MINWTQGDVKDQFVAGKAAMMVNGPWQIPALQKAKIKWDVVTFPLNKPDQTPVAPLGGEAWTVPLNKDQAKQQKAAEFVKCLNSDENELPGLRGRPVPTKPRCSTSTSEVPSMGVHRAVKTARARTGKLGDKWPDAAKVIYQAIQLALTGQALRPTPCQGRRQLTARERKGAAHVGSRDPDARPRDRTVLRQGAGPQGSARRGDRQDPLRGTGRAGDRRALRLPGGEEPGDEPPGLQAADVLHRPGTLGRAEELRDGGHRPAVRQAMVNTALFTIGSIASSS